MERPTLFIASSMEGVKIAEAVEKNLAPDFECVLWKHNWIEGSRGLKEFLTNSWKHKAGF